jgi:hypothetical protein
MSTAVTVSSWVLWALIAWKVYRIVGRHLSRRPELAPAHARGGLLPWLRSVFFHQRLERHHVPEEMPELATVDTRRPKVEDEQALLQAVLADYGEQGGAARISGAVLGPRRDPPPPTRIPGPGMPRSG